MDSVSDWLLPLRNLIAVISDEAKAVIDGARRKVREHARDGSRVRAIYADLASDLMMKGGWSAEQVDAMSAAAHCIHKAEALIGGIRIKDHIRRGIGVVEASRAQKPGHPTVLKQLLSQSSRSTGDCAGSQDDTVPGSLSGTASSDADAATLPPTQVAKAPT